MKYLFSNKIKLVLICLASFSLLSCENQTKTDNTDEQSNKTEELVKEVEALAFDTQNITINWTGYKKTEKTPVKGVFQVANVSNIKSSSNIVEALNGVEFEIPVSSIFSKNEDRDSKLQELFFGVMDNTLSLKGSLTLEENGDGYIDLLMNGVQNKLAIKYQSFDDSLSLSGILDLIDWKAEEAVKSLNEACLDLHKGDDGLSKTWSEVAVSATIRVK